MNDQSPVIPGSPAPDFDLPCIRVDSSTPERARLADYRGRWLIVVFYPRDFSLVCPTELISLSARLGEFRSRGCDLLGISTDTLESHRRWMETPLTRGGLGGLGFPLASDVDGVVSRAYGVYLEWQHVALRGLYVIDPNGVLQYLVVHNLSVGRRSDEILRVLDALQTGGLCGEGWSTTDPNLEPADELGAGSVAGKYRIDARLGSGAFATVFRAHDRMLDRPVALKVLRRDAPRSALEEARAAAALNHPNVCTVFAVEDVEGAPVIAMEYLSGRPLREILASGPLPPTEAARIGAQVAEGLAAAHAAGVIHGDLKPENVIVTDSGIAKVLDFGLARRDPRAFDPDATADFHPQYGSSTFGTPSYMAPEQAESGQAPGPAGDVFTLGAILYETLTGRKAFPGRQLLEVLSQIRSVDPGRLASEVPAPFAAIVRSALQREPAERRITMAELAARLRAVAAAIPPET